MCFSTDYELGVVLKEKETNFSLTFLELEGFGKYQGHFLTISTSPQTTLLSKCKMFIQLPCFAVLREGRDRKEGMTDSDHLSSDYCLRSYDPFLPVLQAA